MERKVQSPALVMRVMKYGFIVAALLFIYMGLKIPVPAHVPVSVPVEIAITFAGLGSVLGGFLLPRFVFRAAERRPQSNPTLTALKIWRSKGMLSLTYFQASVFFGLVLFILRGHEWLVGLLFGAGIAAMLVWSPGKPPRSEEGGRPRS